MRAGDVLDGRYHLESMIGRGGVGEVWRAGDRRGGPPVAIKILKPTDKGGDDAKMRFGREAAVLTALRHVNVSGAIAFSLSEPPYIVMELFEGATLGAVLRERAKRQKPMPFAEALGIATQVAAGIGYAHANRILHRDLKPENVMLLAGASPQAVKVLDFGLAKLLDSTRTALTSSSQVLGSTFWLSPEQIQGKEIGPATDVFGLGCVLFEMLTARYAWARDEQDRPLAYDARLEGVQNVGLTVMRRIVRGERPRPSAWRPAAAKADAVLARALSVDAAQRHPNAAELVADLRRALAGAKDDGVAIDPPAASPHEDAADTSPDGAGATLQTDRQ